MKPEPIKDVIKGVIKGMSEGAPEFNKEQIAKIWTKVAGSRFTKHSRPISFRRSRLIINVDSSSWLYELTVRKVHILRKLKKEFKEKPLKELQFRIGEI